MFAVDDPRSFCDAADTEAMPECDNCDWPVVENDDFSTFLIVGVIIPDCMNQNSSEGNLTSSTATRPRKQNSNPRVQSTLGNSDKLVTFL